MRRVTFSRNYTLSLSRTCQCYCKYCAFATRKAHIYASEEVEARLDEAERRNAKELLVLTGERPEVNPVVAGKLAEWGHEDFTSYVVWACERALERGILPHTNIGVLDKQDLARLREVTASQGLMLESISERLMDTVHAGSPTKHPAKRLATIQAAGELKIPFTSGILVGIGETDEEQVESLEALAELHLEYGHLQEVILQNFVPHPRYYGREVAEIADEASLQRWRESGDSPAGDPNKKSPSGEPPLSLDDSKISRELVDSRGAGGGVSDGDFLLGSPAEGPPPVTPDWASPVSVEDIKRLIAECKRLMPDVGIQVPPNLSDAWAELVEAGATDLGGLSANGDHISPEHAFPSPHQVRKSLSPKGYALTERLCVYPQYMDSEWMEQGVLDVIKLKYWSFIPRKGSGRKSEERRVGKECLTQCRSRWSPYH